MQQKINKEIEKGRRQEAEKAQLQVQVEELSIKVGISLNTLIYFYVIFYSFQ